MKTINEWNLFWMSASGPNTLKELIKAIQSDAFHAGRLKGLEDAKSIVTQWSPSESSPCGQAVKEIERLEKK